MRKLLVIITCGVLFGSCSNNTPSKGEKYVIKDIIQTGSEPYQDYWEKSFGVTSNKKTMFSYDIILKNERQDTVISTHQFIDINKHQWVGKTVFVSDGRIM